MEQRTMNKDLSALSGIYLEYYFHDDHIGKKYEIHLSYDDNSKKTEYTLELGSASIMEDGEGSDYENDGDIDTEIFKELYGQLSELNPKDDVIGNSYKVKKNEDYISFHISAWGSFGEITYNLSGINNSSIEKRGIRKICNIAKKILEITNADKDDWEEFL
jgi:hypothetical protein